MRKKNKKKTISQFGALFFTDESGTSKDCPYCEARQSLKESLDSEAKKKRKKEIEDEKFKNHRFFCGDDNSCGFDTKNISDKHKEQITDEINDPDKVAAYNVAKKVEKLKDKIFEKN